MLSGAQGMVPGWLAVARQDGDLSDPLRRRRPGLATRQLGWPRSKRQSIARRDWKPVGAAVEDFHQRVRRLAFRTGWMCRPFIRAADSVLEFPMVDQDPLLRWSFGRVTAVGRRRPIRWCRAAPTGAGQAILDARARSSRRCSRMTIPLPRSPRMRRQRLEATTRIVLTNRTNPPDAILREVVFSATNDMPFGQIDDVNQPRGTRRAVRKATSGSPAIRRMHCGRSEAKKS